MKILPKLIIFIIFFVILHFACDFLKFDVVKIFSGTDESVFSHLKIAFWSYFLLTIVDFFYSKKKKKDFSFFVSLFINCIIPWFIVLIWYIAPAFFGRIPSELYEILWAFSVLIVVGFFALSLERSVIKVEFDLKAKISIILIFALSIFFFTFFTFIKPWIDLFQIP